MSTGDVELLDEEPVACNHCGGWFFTFIIEVLTVPKCPHCWRDANGDWVFSCD